MKIKVFDKWSEKPESRTSPVSTAGFKPIGYINASRSNAWSIVYHLKNLYQNALTKNGIYLVRLSDDDYINELIGNRDEIKEFIEMCLADAKLLKKDLGKKKIT